MARKKATAEELRRMEKVREFKRKRKELKAGAGADDVKGENVCAICDDGGDLTCCEGCCHRSFHLDDKHDCVKTLGLTTEEAKKIIEKEDFICKNCQHMQHQCFICGSLGSSDNTSSQAEVFQCEYDDCARFYHPKCVAQMLYPNGKQELFEIHVAAGERFSCPMHECIMCNGKENKNDKSMRFAVCRRCPTVYHRKCMPSDILFAPKRGPKAAMRRAWKNMLPDRILIFCMKHEIVRKLQTPARNHIIFPPEANVLKTSKAAPMEQDMTEQNEALDHPTEQDMPEQKEALDHPMEQQDMPGQKEALDHSMEQDMPERKEALDQPMEQDMPKQNETPDRSTPEQNHSSPPPAPPAARDQNQCCCSNPFDSFAPSSLFRHPYPGSCGWLDD